MKKKLEADLISIAHRILKLKNKSELTQLHLESQKLYEKLSVLKFIEDNFSGVKPTIGNSNSQELVIAALDNELEKEVVEVEAAPETVESKRELALEEKAEVEAAPESVETQHELAVEEAVDVAIENSEDQSEASENEDEKADLELFKVEYVKIKKPKVEPNQISFEDLLGSNSEPVFERVFDPIQEEKLNTETTEVLENAFNPVFEMEVLEEFESEEKAIPNTDFDIEKMPKEGLPKTIAFGLNDRIAFEKQLFGGSTEDLNRVVSQLSTFDTFEEAQNFIDEMVKPDYDNWKGKDDYVVRFLEIIENKFY